MKIEKINKDNIKEYIRDMGIDITYVDEKQLINNTFGVKKDNKFLFGFVSLSEEDLISITFGDNKIDDVIVKECVNFLNSNLAFDGRLSILVNEDNLINIMDDLYKVKMISVFKGIIDSDSIPTKERFADIDMKSIKYFYSKNDIVCNLYAQNIQDENIITKLDDFFDNNNYSLVEFIIFIFILCTVVLYFFAIIGYIFFSSLILLFVSWLYNKIIVSNKYFNIIY